MPGKTMNTLPRKLFILCCVAALLMPVHADGPQANPAAAQSSKAAAKKWNAYLTEADEYSLDHLEKAREYRTQGRYELARQEYLKALSICADQHTHAILQRELNGVELLLRTMR